MLHVLEIRSLAVKDSEYGRQRSQACGMREVRVHMDTVSWLFFGSFFFVKQKTAYEMRISDWSSDVCSSDLDADTRATYDMVCRAETVGVFQIESRAQMTMLPRLRPKSMYDLTVQVAIVRPGPIQGGMVHPYLKQRGLPEDAIQYPLGKSDPIKGVLGRTTGVPIFQEQVMQIAMVAAGFSASRADALRRAMAAWKRNGHVDRFREELTEGMKARGYSDEFAARIFRQIEGFGSYGFPESHAASFALLAYKSAWLKQHRQIGRASCRERVCQYV